MNVITADADVSLVYRLALVPEFNVQHVLFGWELVLTDSDGTANLLEPEGRWHGLQPYDFNRTDLANGPTKTVDGPRREIIVKSRKLRATIVVVEASADGVRLRVDVGNL